MKENKIFTNLLLSSFTVMLIFLICEILFNIYFDYNYSPRNFDKENLDNEKLIAYIRPYELVKHYHYNDIMNSIGFRDLEFENKSDKRRIIVMGDSFTFGFGINKSEDTYPKKLERYLKKSGEVEIFNFGFLGLNTLDIYWVLKNKATRYKPDMIIYGFYYNDIEFSIQNIDYNYCMMYENPNFINYLNLGRYKIVRKTKNIRTEEISKLKIDYFSSSNPFLECFDKTLSYFSEYSKKENIPFVIVYIPNQPFKNKTDEYNSIIPKIKEISIKYNLTFIDTSEEIWEYTSTKRPNEVYVDYENKELHYNKEVNEIIAESLYYKLIKEFPDFFK